MSSWRDYVRSVVPYTPGEQPQVKNIVKLNTNENPYPPAPGVERIIKEMDYKRLKLYPDPKVSELVRAIAENYSVKEEEVFVGVGSDDVIAMSFLTFFNSDKPILFPDISYSFYSVWADLFKIPYKKQRLDENFNIIKEDYFQENGGIIIPNPNAPTATEIGLELVEEILYKNKSSLVIIDEAYVDFGSKSAIELISKHDNLLVVQTFSKSRSMAGTRIGYAIGNQELIKALNDVKHSFNSYTMNYPSIIMGVEAVKDKDYFEKTINKIIKTREEAKKEFKKLGFSFTDSKANFLFVKHEKIPAKQIFEYLKSKKIYVRYFELERIDNYLRITIGTDDEMKILFDSLEEMINACK